MFVTSLFLYDKLDVILIFSMVVRILINYKSKNTLIFALTILYVKKATFRLCMLYFEIYIKLVYLQLFFNVAF